MIYMKEKLIEINAFYSEKLDSIEINYIIYRVIWAYYNIKNHDILKIMIIMI